VEETKDSLQGRGQEINSGRFNGCEFKHLSEFDKLCWIASNNLYMIVLEAGDDKIFML
jgi:hypothetical protein